MTLASWLLVVSHLMSPAPLSGSPATTRRQEPEATQQAGSERRLRKPDERAKFHPSKVTGMAAADRTASYQKRLALEAASPFGGLQWRGVGPEIQGGRVIDIDAPLGDPQKLFVSFATGGLYVTEDDGLTWKSLFDKQASFGIGAVAVSRDGKTIYLGSGEANSQRTSYAGDGVYKSTDGGKTWANVGLPESQHIGQVVINPKNENEVWVAALGHLYSQNSERGVYHTTDGGKTWTQSLKVDDYTGAIDIVVNPKNPSIVIASMWDRDRRAWNFRESGAGSAVYRTENGGKTWSKVTALPVGEAAGRTGLAICASKPEVVYALVDNQEDDSEWLKWDEKTPSGRLTAKRFLLLTDETFPEINKDALTAFLRRSGATDLKAEELIEQVKSKKLTVAKIKEQIEAKNPNAFDPGEAGAQLYRSDDTGKTWKRTEGGALGSFGGYYWGEVWVNPADANDVYVMGVPILRSTDGGKTWKSVAEDAHVDHHAVWHDPRDPRKVWIGNDGGLYVTYDGGKTVRHVNNLSVGQATTLALDNKRPYGIYLGFQDNGTSRGPSNYRPGQSNPNDWVSLFGGDGSHIAVDPRDDGDLVYVAYQFGEHFAINQKTKAQWRTRAEPAKGEPAARYNWISPLIVSSHQPDILYIGNQRVYRSFNQGRKWEPISPDLTKNKQNGDVPFSTIKDLSESPLRFGLLYAGCDDGSVKMTPNGGYEWIDIKTPQPDKWVSRIVASKWDVATVYCSQSGYREDDFSAYLWKSTDYGKTWKSIVGDLPAETINVVREDPIRKDILYVGTDLGVFVSYNGGQNWETLHGGLGTQPVHDLAIQERDKDLVIATHSRGAYVLPLKNIHALTPEIRKADVTVFDIESVLRRSTWGLEGRARWNSEPAAEPKAVVPFYSARAGKATLRLLDKDKKVVKEITVDSVLGFNSADFSLQLTPPKPSTVDLSKRQAKAAAEALADPLADFRATFVAIGEYTLEVEIDGKKASKPFKVLDGLLP